MVTVEILAPIPELALVVVERRGRMGMGKTAASVGLDRITTVRAAAVRAVGLQRPGATL